MEHKRTIKHESRLNETEIKAAIMAYVVSKMGLRNRASEKLYVSLRSDTNCDGRETFDCDVAWEEKQEEKSLIEDILDC